MRFADLLPIRGRSFRLGQPSGPLPGLSDGSGAHSPDRTATVGAPRAEVVQIECTVVVFHGAGQNRQHPRVVVIDAGPATAVLAHGAAAER